MVSSVPAGISCGADCRETYSAGTVVTLSATPAASATFAGWSGDCTGTGPCTVTMNATQTVSALFETAGPVENVTLSVVPLGAGDGTVTSTPVGIDCGDIDLTYNTDYVDVDQLIGLRFTDLNISPGATIVDARIQFTVDHPTGGYVKLDIYGQADPQALTFVHQKVGDISDRPRTTASALWEPSPWQSQEGTVNDRAALSVDLTPIVQEVVNLPGWQKRSNGLVFIIAGDPANGVNRRRAVSFEDVDTKARLLVTYNN